MGQTRSCPKSWASKIRCDAEGARLFICKLDYPLYLCIICASRIFFVFTLSKRQSRCACRWANTENIQLYAIFIYWYRLLLVVLALNSSSLARSSWASSLARAASVLISTGQASTSSADTQVLVSSSYAVFLPQISTRGFVPMQRKYFWQLLSALKCLNNVRPWSFFFFSLLDNAQVFLHYRNVIFKIITLSLMAYMKIPLKLFSDYKAINKNKPTLLLLRFFCE